MKDESVMSIPTTPRTLSNQATILLIRYFLIFITTYLSIKYINRLLKFFQLKITPLSNEERLRLAKKSFRISASSFRKQQRKQNHPKQQRREGNGQKQNFKNKKVNVIAKINTSKKGVVIIAIDCEMVGVGRHGKESELARCSIVEMIDGASDSLTSCEEFVLKNTTFRILYDKVVRPRRRVVDYRTAYSGITEDIINGNGPLSVVDYDDCRRDVAQMLASLRGKPVVLVGHALQNDFDVLGLQHPEALVRDTATYPPFTKRYHRGGRRSHRILPRKLSQLAAEELSLTIQSSRAGHSSVEDAASALLLYHKHRSNWEASLGHPLRPATGTIGRNGEYEYPELTLLIDGCNLPLAVRNDTSLIQILSKQQKGKTTNHYYDWVPLFRSLLCNDDTPYFKDIRVIFDGSKYRQCQPEKRPRTGSIIPGLVMEMTEDGASADDVIVETCTRLTSAFTRHKKLVTNPLQMTSLLSSHTFQNDTCPNFYTLRRPPFSPSSSKKHRKLLSQLHLNRAEEGVYCLPCFTTKLTQSSLRVAKLCQDYLVNDDNNGKALLECRVGNRADVKVVVVTGDVYLAERVERCGGVVLTFQQMQSLCL